MARSLAVFLSLLAQWQGVRPSPESLMSMALVPVASVVVSPPRVEGTVGGTVQLSAVALDAKGKALSGRTVTWSSSNPSVLSVTGGGLVTAMAGGSVTISATSEGRTATTTVAVVPTLADLEPKVVVRHADLVLVVGETEQLVYRLADGKPLIEPSVTWSSDDAWVASVTLDGRVTGRQPGLATITANHGGRSAAISVSVLPLGPPVPWWRDWSDVVGAIAAAIAAAPAILGFVRRRRYKRRRPRPLIVLPLGAFGL